MGSPTLNVSSTGDLSFMRSAIGDLQNAKTYVGIPERGANRKRDFIGPLQKGGSYVSNAGLLYIHTNGSSLHHIPPRPVIEPAIQANRLQIESMLFQAAQFALNGKKREMNRQIKLVGTFAANVSKEWFTNPRNGWPQNAVRTIMRKTISKIRGKKKRKAAINMVLAIRAKQDLMGKKLMPTYGREPALDAINTPLIDTGQLRRAITHVENV